MREHFAHAMAGCLGRDHADIDVGMRDDLAEADVEAVREHQRLAALHVRRNLLVVDLRLADVGRQDHHDLRLCGGLGDGPHRQSGRLDFRARLRFGMQADAHIQAAVAQVQRVGMALAAKADDRDRLAAQTLEDPRRYRNTSWP